ncbi:universal stress protein [Streptomyces purpurogeneiscleroticus]|uniref:universal stress protein n=1 Tax=Streptomyces purpurogeneiscleroticus TaxID=68259 RepID=UPI001CBE9F4D|nr:universal stress protein [Streptomyces purpurogeneiscleroticus]MBZ4018751.1 universal stress protein [Streptomyces purpurogeneiscleroticus]
MAHPLVVGVDGSGTSLDAVDWAADAAARYGIPLRIVYGSRWERYEGYLPDRSTERSSERVTEETIVGVAADRASRRVPGLEITTNIAPDDPVEALLAEGRRAKAVVVGHRGRGRLTSLLLGSVGLGVAARAHCPVIVVRGRTENILGGEPKVVLGVGERLAGTAAAMFALEEGALRDCTVEAVHAWRCAGTEVPEQCGAHGEYRAEHELRAKELFNEVLNKPVAAFPQVTMERRAVEGAPGTVLVAASHTADLLVVGAHRRHGHAGLQLGLVTHAVLHHAQCPVAVVPET